MNSDSNPEVDSKKPKRSKEILLWAFICFICFFSFGLQLIKVRNAVSHVSISFDLVSFIVQNAYLVILGIISLIIPGLSKLIFGIFPLEYFFKNRNIRKERFNDQTTNRPLYSQSADLNNANVNEIDKSTLTKDYRIQCVDESKAISEKVYTRSGSLLYLGCFIALLGIYIFYFVLNPNITSNDAENISERLFDNFPRFGALCFIELIAFFFLKQYRIGLEEFRYYEAIKRKRQDELNFIHLINVHKDDKQLLDVFKTLSAIDIPRALKKGETTQTLEIQKLSMKDLDFIGKIADLFKSFKGR